jgi:transposase-like protein
MTKKVKETKRRLPRLSWAEKWPVSVLYTQNAISCHWEGIQISEVRQYIDGTLIISACYRPTRIKCPRCSCADIADLVVHVRDSRRAIVIPPINGEATVLWCSQDRWKCKPCGYTFTPQIPNVMRNHRMTTAVRNIVYRLGKTRTFAEIGRELGISSSTVKKVLKEDPRVLNFISNRQTPNVLGVDGFYLSFRCEKHSHKVLSCTMLTNLQDPCIFDILPVGERTKDASIVIPEWFQRISDLDKIVAVVIDPSDTFRGAIKKTFPNAIRIVDKAHMIRGEVKHHKIWHDQHNIAFLKDMSRITNAVRRGVWVPDRDVSRDTVFTSIVEEKLIRDHLLGLFCSVYAAHNRKDAEARLNEWRASIPSYMLSDYKERIKVVESWWDEILAIFDSISLILLRSPKTESVMSRNGTHQIEEVTFPHCVSGRYIPLQNCRKRGPRKLVSISE